jgi:hypothetical protein
MACACWTSVAVSEYVALIANLGEFALGKDARSNSYYDVAL